MVDPCKESGVVGESEDCWLYVIAYDLTKQSESRSRNA
jgi:hypothetical protein